ncbi:bifunctional UDP-N-acetylglucosamine diphosphorylase/glucosamine-1-phosphate N-acetyltransferase GlmU [Atopobium fossor]|uniref:bifunctional UDP-N-acetylglucosamine diphosphorylase/glucosamine-1-phosphate N-acetyltransferase GlmU n=1 Tax=Atopobium fossor TaxID=39487 RepID=UPI0004015CD6|nr:bifunctional UDP-N-acetylglucosamine diphosphorylase/glucosamine-1-phosphate N-acetyltransferase GlmU [Atopobium fossor]
MPLTAIVLAAGEGTRMKSRHPKVMHKLLDRPLVGWTVDCARRAGCSRIIVVVGHGAQEVRDYLSTFDDVEFVEQPQQLGTGHAVRCVFDTLFADAPVNTINDRFVVLYGDSPLMRPQTISWLTDKSTARNDACTILTMTPPSPTGYGRIVFEGGQVKAIIEHKDCTPAQQEELRECNSGMYCFEGSSLAQGIAQLSNNNAQGEYYLTDMIAWLNKHGSNVSAVHCEEYTELLGVNSRVQLASASKIMQQRINQQHMENGVTMLDPTSVWIGPEVTIGQDTEILPNTLLFGHTSVGTNCVLGPSTRLTNATVGNNCTVDETIIVDSSIDNNVSCGPRAYLRGGTHFKDGAKAGTHVELKNTVVGEGSKVPHLSYLGDTTMGSGVNIGGGSITCNYDGVHKNKTTIGNNAFVGSDTMMVAPVTIGEGAVTGASSCIYEDVPAGALGIERSRQVIKEGFATARQQRLEKGNK